MITFDGQYIDFDGSRIVIPRSADLSQPWPYSRGMWCGANLDGMSPFWLSFLDTNWYDLTMINKHQIRSTMYASLADRLYVMNVECPEMDHLMDDGDPMAVGVIGKTLISTRKGDAYKKLDASPRPFAHFLETVRAADVTEFRGVVERIAYASSRYQILTFTLSVYDANKQLLASHFPVVAVADQTTTDAFWTSCEVSSDGMASIDAMENWEQTDHGVEFVITDDRSGLIRLECIDEAANFKQKVGDAVMTYAGIGEDLSSCTGYMAPLDLFSI